MSSVILFTLSKETLLIGGKIYRHESEEKEYMKNNIGKKSQKIEGLMLGRETETLF